MNGARVVNFREALHNGSSIRHPPLLDHGPIRHLCASRTLPYQLVFPHQAAHHMDVRLNSRSPRWRVTRLAVMRPGSQKRT